jgi:L-ascorbate metabolism protein UlaG (beta-lactamase superfamily)
MDSLSLTLTTLCFCCSLFGQAAPQFSSIQKMTNAEMQLKLSGQGALRYRVDVSDDALAWRPFVTFGGQSTNEHIDSQAPYLRQRFYRAEELSGTNIFTGDHIATSDGDVIIHPINHATFVMKWKGITIYNDPVGTSTTFQGLPKGDLILVSHGHSDHFSASAIPLVRATNGIIIAPRAITNSLSAALRAATITLTNGASTNVLQIGIEGVPAYNSNHPRGEGNGYVITIGGKRFYMSGDTGDIPETRALQNIEVAFLCMNVPFTMNLTSAVAVTRAFKPKVLYPYHYRNQDNTFTDLNSLKRQVGTDLGIEVRARKWY